MESPAVRRGTPSGSIRIAERITNGANKIKMQPQMIIQSHFSNRSQRVNDLARLITRPICPNRFCVLSPIYFHRTIHKFAFTRALHSIHSILVFLFPFLPEYHLVDSVCAVQSQDYSDSKDYVGCYIIPNETARTKTKTKRTAVRIKARESTASTKG